RGGGGDHTEAAEVRKLRLRGLVKFVPVIRRGAVYTDFEDELGELSLPVIRGMPFGPNKTRFEARLRTYLRSHADQNRRTRMRIGPKLLTLSSCRRSVHTR